MARRKAPRIPDALLDQLLAGADPKTAFDANGLLDDLKKALAERALNAEMDHHLASDEAGNSRNGYGRKTVTTETGRIELEIPRDRQASFDPQLIAKYQRRFPGFDEKIVSMYARGMSARHRLTRSLADFAKLVELFDVHSVSFVSVTQAFNTTNSMGRLTLNVLLSFAQFEREVTGERIRDKIAASKQKGIWMGGVVPLGYRAESRALHIVEEHAEAIRSIYDRYRALGSVARLSDELDRSDTKIPLRIDGTGKRTGGGKFSRGHLRNILSNPIYVGQIRHRGCVHACQHPPIIDPILWDEVQASLKGRGNAHRHHAIAAEHILTGRIRDDAGQPMSPTHTSKGSKRYRYYVSSSLQQGWPSTASIRRIPATEIEGAISDAIATATGSDLSGRALIEQHLRQVTIRLGMLEIELSDDRLLQIDWTYTPSRRRREIVVPADASAAIHPMKVEDRDRILKAIGQGRAWLAELTDGLVASPDMIASRQAVSERTIRNTIAMALLSPTIVSAIVDGRLPRGIGIARFAELPAAWSEQHAALGI